MSGGPEIDGRSSLKCFRVGDVHEPGFQRATGEGCEGVHPTKSHHSSSANLGILPPRRRRLIRVNCLESLSHSFFTYSKCCTSSSLRINRGGNIILHILYSLLIVIQAVFLLSITVLSRVSSAVLLHQGTYYSLVAVRVDIPRHQKSSAPQCPNTTTTTRLGKRETRGSHETFQLHSRLGPSERVARSVASEPHC